MSRSPYFFVERFDKNTGKYELQHPIVWNYNHTKQEPADLLPYNGCHELFSILEEQEMNGIHAGLPKDVCEDIYKAYHKDDEYEGYMPTAHWFTYADMYIYCLEHPKVKLIMMQWMRLIFHRMMKKLNISIQILL